MKTWFTTLGAAIVLSSVAFLTGLARLMIDVRFVPEVFNAMPENQPGQTATVILLFVVLYGGWLWALLAATRNSRLGLIALLIFNLIIAFAWGLATLITLCPAPCAVAYPLTDIVTWANVISGLVAAITVGLQLGSKPQPAAE